MEDPQTPDVHALASRLDALERLGRRRRAIVAALAVVAVTALLLGQAAGPAAEQLELRNGEGGVYASLRHTRDQGAALVLLDGKERERVSLRVAADGAPSIRLVDRAGSERVELALLDESTPRILLRDDAGTERAKLLLMPEGSPLLYLKDATGTTRVELASLWTGLNGLVVFNPDERPQVVLTAAPEAGASLRLADGAGVGRLKVGVGPRGAPRIETAGPDGKTSWQAPPQPEAEKKPPTP